MWRGRNLGEYSRFRESFSARQRIPQLRRITHAEDANGLTLPRPPTDLTFTLDRRNWRLCEFRRRWPLWDVRAERKRWFYPALSKKVNPDNPQGEDFFNHLLDSPLRVVISVTPVKRIMYNSALAARHMAGTVSEDELGQRLASDAQRRNAERDRRGLERR